MILEVMRGADLTNKISWAVKKEATDIHTTASQVGMPQNGGHIIWHSAMHLHNGRSQMESTKNQQEANAP